MLSPQILAGPLAVFADEPRRAIAHAAQLNWRAVQLSASQPGVRPRDLGVSARRDLLAALRRHEIECAGLDLWIPPHHLEDDQHVDRAMSAILAAIELASDLGRVPVSLLLPANDDAKDGDDARHALRRTLGDAALYRGVDLADHTVSAWVERDAARHAGSAGVGLGVDPAAWLSHDELPEEAVIRCAADLVVARFNDLTAAGLRVPPGAERDGRLDFMAYRAALAVAEYARPVVVDTRQWPDPLGGLAIARQAWESSMVR